MLNNDLLLEAYRTVGGMNGKLNPNDPSQLVEIEPGHYLHPEAARKWNAMRDAARQDGINLSINNAYRSYPQQVAMANKFGLYSRGGRAAVPGTSNHGWGTALDLNVKSNPQSLAWLRQNASKFGFKNIPREPWHWETNKPSTFTPTNIAPTMMAAPFASATPPKPVFKPLDISPREPSYRVPAVAKRPPVMGQISQPVRTVPGNVFRDFRQTRRMLSGRGY